MNDPDITGLRCSVQRALFEEVTERLIAVTAGQQGHLIRLIAYFSGEPTEDEKQSIWYVGGYVIGDYPSPFTIQEEFRWLPEHPLEGLDIWAFRRRMGPRRPRPPAADPGRVYSEHPYGNLLCAFQVALLDEVTVGLVRVDTAFIASGGSPEIPIWAYFSRPITQEDEQTFRDVAARVAACFPPHCVVVPRCLPWPPDTPSGRPDYSGYPDRTVFCVFAVKPKA